MEFKGTKGKWEVMKVYGLGTPFIVYVNDETIFQCYNSKQENDAQANAQLIASATEMFEMLKKVNDFIIENKNKNYMVALLKREVPEINELLTKITTL